MGFRHCFFMLFSFLIGKFSLQLNAQNDSGGNWNFSLYADMYYGKNYTVSDNTEQSISELVSFHRFNEISLNTGFAILNYSDSTKFFSAGAGIGTYMLRNMTAEPLGYRNILQCYGGVKLFNEKSIWLEAGIMPSHIGYESAISMDQPTLTRSMVSDFSPYFETGMKLKGDFKHFNFSALMLNGWQRIWRSNQEPGNHFGVQAQYSKDKFLFNYSGYCGGLGVNNANVQRVFHDVYTKFSMGKTWNIWLLVDVGCDKQVISKNFWWGTAAVIRCDINSKSAISARLETFKDPNRRIVLSTVKAAEIFGFSINGDVLLRPQVLLRLELKQLQASDYIFFNANSTFTRSSLQGLLSIAWKLMK